MAVTVKRVYEKPHRGDGARVLVDRLWPRGLKKEAAGVHSWLKDLAPSDGLRKWFHAHPQAWIGFRKRYLKELAAESSAADLDALYRLANKRKNLTLLFASKNETHNNAVVLRDLLDGMRKPPTGTGPGGATGKPRPRSQAYASALSVRVRVQADGFRWMKMQGKAFQPMDQVPIRESCQKYRRTNVATGVTLQNVPCGTFCKDEFDANRTARSPVSTWHLEATGRS